MYNEEVKLFSVYKWIYCAKRNVIIYGVSLSILYRSPRESKHEHNSHSNTASDEKICSYSYPSDRKSWSFSALFVDPTPEGKKTKLYSQVRCAINYSRLCCSFGKLPMKIGKL